MSNCSLKCSVLPCVHIQNSKSEINIEDPKENNSPQSYKNDVDTNELNNTSNDNNNNICDKSSDDLNLNIDSCYTNSININSNMDNINMNEDSNENVNTDINTSMNHNVNSSTDSHRNDDYKFNMKINLSAYRNIYEKGKGNAHPKESNSSAQKGSKGILLNTYNYYFYNNFGDINKRNKKREDDVNIYFYKKVSRNVPNCYENESSQNSSDYGHVEKSNLYNSKNCNYNNQFFGINSYDKVFLKELKITNIDNKYKKKSVKKYNIPFEPNFYSNRFFFSDKNINEGHIGNNKNIKVNNSLSVNNNIESYNNSERYSYVLQFEGPPPHFLIVKRNNITKQSTVVKRISINKNISFNLAKFIAEKYIHILNKNIKRVEKRLKRLENNKNVNNNSNSNYNAIESDKVNNVSNNECTFDNNNNSPDSNNHNGLNSQKNDDYNNSTHSESNRHSYNSTSSKNYDESNHNNNDVSNSMNISFASSENDNECDINKNNEYSKHTINNSPDNINYLNYEDRNMENTYDEQMFTNECLNIDLDNIVFNSDAEGYIKFLNNVKIYVLQRIEEENNIPLDAKELLGNKLVILVKMKQGFCVKSKTFIFENVKGIENEYKNKNDNNSSNRLEVKIEKFSDRDSVNSSKNVKGADTSNVCNNNEPNSENDKEENNKDVDSNGKDNNNNDLCNIAIKEEVSEKEAGNNCNNDKSVTIKSEPENKNINSDNNLDNDANNETQEIELSENYKKQIYNFIHDNIYINSYIYDSFENTYMNKKFFKNDVIIVNMECPNDEIIDDAPDYIYELNKFVFIKFVKYENYIKKNHKIAEGYIEYLLQSNIKCINNYMIGIRWVPDLFSYEYYVCKITERDIKSKDSLTNVKYNYSLTSEKDSNEEPLKYLVDYENKPIDSVLWVLHEYYQASLFTEKCLYNLFKLVLLRISMYIYVFNAKVITLDLDKAMYRMKKFSEPISLLDNNGMADDKMNQKRDHNDILLDNVIDNNYNSEEINKNDNYFNAIINSQNENNSFSSANDGEPNGIDNNDNEKNKGESTSDNDTNNAMNNEGNSGEWMNDNNNNINYNEMLIKQAEYEQDKYFQNKLRNKKKVSYNLDNISLSLRNKDKNNNNKFGILKENGVNNNIFTKYYGPSGDNKIVTINNNDIINKGNGNSNKKGYNSNTSDVSDGSHLTTKHKYHLRSNNAQSTDNYSSEENASRNNLGGRSKVVRNRTLYKMMNKNGLVEPYWWFFYNLYENATIKDSNMNGECSNTRSGKNFNLAKSGSAFRPGEKKMNNVFNKESSLKKKEKKKKLIYDKLLEKKYNNNLLNHLFEKKKKIKVRYISMVHDVIYKKFILLNNTIFPRNVHESEILYTLFPHEPQTFMFLYTNDDYQYQNEVFLKNISYDEYLMASNNNHLTGNIQKGLLGDISNNIDSKYYREGLLPIDGKYILDQINPNSSRAIGKDFGVDHLILGGGGDANVDMINYGGDSSSLLFSTYNNLKFNNIPNYDKIKKGSKVIEGIDDYKNRFMDSYNILLSNGNDCLNNISIGYNDIDNNFGYISNTGYDIVGDGSNELIDNIFLQNPSSGYHKDFDFEKRNAKKNNNDNYYYYNYFVNGERGGKTRNNNSKRSVSNANFGRDGVGSRYYDNYGDDENKKNKSDYDMPLVKKRKGSSKRAKSNNLTNVRNYDPLYHSNKVESNVSGNNNNDTSLIPMGPLPTGVYFDSARKLWRCQWKENGKFKTKGFSLIHYNTLEEARKQCILYRCDVGNIPVKSEWLNPVYVSSSYFYNKKCATSSNTNTTSVNFGASHKELKTSSLNLSSLKDKTDRISGLRGVDGGNAKIFAYGSSKDSSDNYYEGNNNNTNNNVNGRSRYSTRNNTSPSESRAVNNDNIDEIDISILKEFVQRNKKDNTYEKPDKELNEYNTKHNYYYDYDKIKNAIPTEMDEQNDDDNIDKLNDMNNTFKNNYQDKLTNDASNSFYLNVKNENNESAKNENAGEKLKTGLQALLSMLRFKDNKEPPIGSNNNTGNLSNGIDKNVSDIIGNNKNNEKHNREIIDGAYSSDIVEGEQNGRHGGAGIHSMDANEEKSYPDDGEEYLDNNNNNSSTSSNNSNNTYDNIKKNNDLGKLNNLGEIGKYSMDFLKFINIKNNKNNYNLQSNMKKGYNGMLPDFLPGKNGNEVALNIINRSRKNSTSSNGNNNREETNGKLNNNNNKEEFGYNNDGSEVFFNDIQNFLNFAKRGNNNPPSGNTNEFMNKLENIGNRNMLINYPKGKSNKTKKNTQHGHHKDIYEKMKYNNNHIGLGSNGNIYGTDEGIHHSGNNNNNQKYMYLLDKNDKYEQSGVNTNKNNNSDPYKNDSENFFLRQLKLFTREGKGMSNNNGNNINPEDLKNKLLGENSKQTLDYPNVEKETNDYNTRKKKKGNTYYENNDDYYYYDENSNEYFNNFMDNYNEKYNDDGYNNGVNFENKLMNDMDYIDPGYNNKKSKKKSNNYIDSSMVGNNNVSEVDRKHLEDMTGMGNSGMVGNENNGMKKGNAGGEGNSDIDINLIKQSLPKGIYYDHAKKLYRVQYIVNNSIKTKGFSVKKLGLAEAKLEAESFRNFCLENGLLNSRKRRINSPYNNKKDEKNFKMLKDDDEILSNLLYLYNSNAKDQVLSP
ncbi:transcription factor with AP2 domain(s), putative [Plasmodium vinckei brucechwatti]|uniref:Transcription factor with AP2 domain(S), putative n=1 Tax=Plasmodium vinckei brucechwatti TaxID=119398 RepID=A0A6V7RXK9_PLAVN|nr:transcription factor with AP2 domain(s), putative [Plasmodium vinckei brucechwatti]